MPTLPAGLAHGHDVLGGPLPPAAETSPITGPPYIVYVVANSARYGVSVRLKAEVIPNLATGQLTTVFNENPEQPFSNLTLHFNRGALTSVANPLICGTPVGSSSFTPVATEGGPGRQRVDSASRSPAAHRRFRSRSARALSTNRRTPPDTAPIPSTSAARKASSTCRRSPPRCLPASSVRFRMSRSVVNRRLPRAPVGQPARSAQPRWTAGSGSFPYSFSGPVYMTGPYNGAPFGLSIAVPAVAGPFNLGTIVTRSTININPTTARVTAESVLPTIVGGIPITSALAQRGREQAGLHTQPDQLLDCEQTESTLTSTFGTVQTGLNSPVPGRRLQRARVQTHVHSDHQRQTFENQRARAW